MASLAHAVVGLAGARALRPAARLDWTCAAALAALALLPDADVIAFAFRIPYAAPFGHRGATHSILFALASGALAAAVIVRTRPVHFGRAFLVAFAVAVSHPLLDALTDGGLGVALLWPVSNHRYFAPWRPIPVAPIGAGMLSGRGLYVMAFEAIASLPLLLWALWPRRRSAQP